MMVTVTVTHYSRNSGWAASVITDSVISIPSFTDTGTEEFNTAIIKLDASFGNFITVNQILRDDRIRIQVTADDGTTYNKVFNVKKTIPIKSKSEGSVLQLNLRGIEDALDDVNFSKRIDFAFPSDAIIDISTHYNLNRGSQNPIVGHNIVMPKVARNTFEFGITEEKSFTRLQEIIDSQAASVDEGGQFDFFELNATYSTANVTSLTLNVFPSGQTNSNEVITSVISADGSIDGPTGTVINAWGATALGSLPVDFSRFASAQLRFENYPLFTTGISYPQNAKVRHNGVVYRSNISNNTSTPPTNWTALTAAQDYGNVIQYSPYTVGKANLWRASGCDYSSIALGAGMWDSNLVVSDNRNQYFQTWVNDGPGINNTSAISTNFRYGGTAFYEGFRILVGSSPSGELAGNDSNGRARANSIVEYTKKSDGNFEWRVKYVTTTGMRCAVIRSGIIFKYNGTSWVSAGDTIHCWHPYDSVTNTTSIVTGTSFTLNNNSAIRFRYRFNLPALLSDPTEYQRAGAWACFSLPFPHNKFFTFTEGVGELYGGSTGAFQVPFIDAQNMSYTSKGLIGFNQGKDSEDLGPINAVAFWCVFAFYTDPTGLGGYTHKVQDGNFQLRCAIYDRDDNVAVQDFTIMFNDHPQEVKLPFDGFQIYRAIKPFLNVADAVIPPKQLDAQNRFDWRHIKCIAIHTLDNYAGDGRFASSVSGIVHRFISPALPDTTPATPNIDQFRQIDLIIDGFRFVKPLLVNSGKVTDYVREPEFLDRSDIGDYYQLNGIVQAELQRSRFEKTLFNITTDGTFKTKHGDSFHYEDSNFINYNDGGTNRVKLVAKKLTYSLTKPTGGVGGLVRTISAGRRFV